MTNKAKEYRDFINRMLDDMEEDEQFSKVVFTIVHHHFIRQQRINCLVNSVRQHQ